MAIDTLSEREREVLRTVFDLDGDLKRSAGLLGISHITVRNHLHKNIFMKLRVNSLPGAFRVALGLKLIDLKSSLENFPPDLYIEREFLLDG